MRGDERAIAVVREWLAKAEGDLLAAAHLLKLGRRAPAEIVCFHAQQCAEKYVKAFLAWRRMEFPKTHDLVLLAGRLPASLQTSLDVADLALLNPHAILSRYPGAGAISPPLARRVLAAARRVRTRLRAHLPKRVIAEAGETSRRG